VVFLPDDQATRLQCFKNALRNWNYDGYVDFKVRVVEENLPAYLPGCSPREIAHQLYLFVSNGGLIDEQVERRPEWKEYEFHYDLRVPIAGRQIYFETILICEDADDPDDPTIVVVSVHDV
jgi:hypothetical protein